MKLACALCTHIDKHEFLSHVFDKEYARERVHIQ
jgi:hypothetical protein